MSTHEFLAQKRSAAEILQFIEDQAQRIVVERKKAQATESKT